MGFIQELGKGFIRSAVNQVGRDTGKIISNKIYGDAHATPIRNVGQSTSGTYFDTNTNQQLTLEQVLQYANSDGWIPEYSSYTWAQRFWLMVIAVIIGSFLFPFSLTIPLVPIYLIYLGIKHINKKQTTYIKNVDAPTYKSDRRYKGGVKFDGMTSQKISISLNSTKEDKKKHNSLGFSYILCAIALWFAACFGGSYIMNLKSNTNDGITTEQAIDTVTIQK